MALALGLAAFGAACGDDSSSGGSVEAWCGLMDEANEVDQLFDEFVSLDPAAMETALNRVAEVVKLIEPAAPPEIKDDAKVLADSTTQLIDAVAAADYSLLDADVSFLSDPAEQAKVDAANDNLDEFSKRECGQPFGGESDDVSSDDGSGDDGSGDDSTFDPAAGTIREQLVNQFVSIGLTQEEAECMADNVDPADESVLSGDQEAVFALFEACGISLSRLAELGG